MAERTCGWCGGSLEGRHPNARYCHACRSASCAERARERYAERKREGTAYQHPQQTAEQKARYAERRRQVEQTPEGRALDRERQRAYRARRRDQGPQQEAAPASALRAPACTCTRPLVDPDEAGTLTCVRCGKGIGAAAR